MFRIIDFIYEGKIVFLRVDFNFFVEKGWIMSDVCFWVVLLMI